VIRAMLQDSITSLRNSVGQTVTALVSGDLKAPDGRTVLPSGSAVQLSIERLAPARTRSARDGELVLRADSVVSSSGHVYALDADIRPIPHELRGRGVTAGEAEKVGAGAAAGAVVGGAVTGKAKGAVIGGAVGAVGGAVVAAQTASRDVVVAPRTQLTLVLRSPVVRGR
jgi:outer membrane protein with glycine zipper